MQIELTADEARTLRLMLENFLPELRWEVARTEVREFRHDMVKRQELCERLLSVLPQAEIVPR